MYCSEEVKGNLDPARRVVCGHCTLRMVLYVRNLEEETGIKIVDSTHYALASTRRRTKKERINLSKELESARKSRGWSLRQLADYLELGHTYVTRMEQGVKPLNQKALEFIKLVNRKGVPLK